jgi:hypothetical protein
LILEQRNAVPDFRIHRDVQSGVAIQVSQRNGMTSSGQGESHACCKRVGVQAARVGLIAIHRQRLAEIRSHQQLRPTVGIKISGANKMRMAGSGDCHNGCEGIGSNGPAADVAEERH